MAVDSNAIQRPVWLSIGRKLEPLAWVPSAARVCSAIAPVRVSTAKMSVNPLTSPITRFGASEAKAAWRPLPESVGCSEEAVAWTPCWERLRRRTRLVWLSNRKMSRAPLVSPATRLEASEAKTV